jgi:hypothetical protein
MLSSNPGSTKLGWSTLWIVASVSLRSKDGVSFQTEEKAGLPSESVLERGNGEEGVRCGLEELVDSDVEDFPTPKREWSSPFH